MGKTSRRTKAKKKDFNKVKLKVGKKKPAAENSTSTAFKSQSVYIPEQLQSQENIPAELLTHRKQSVDDLLSHLNHFSPTFRCQALNGLKEILSNHQSNKSIDGMKICERVIRSVTDVDSQVRKASTSVLWHIFSVVPERQISPSFPLILSHLFCAMSHISKDVQRDSLKVVDLCFEFFPNLVCSDENRLNLLQHFIELISSKQGERLANSRVLTMNLSKKESAIAWRIKVLTRLSALLKNTPTVDPTNTVNNNKVKWDGGEVGLHLIPNIKRQHGVLLRNLESSSVVKVQQKTTTQTISTILPLLFQCWLEVSANGILTRDQETVTTMNLVLNITLELCTRSKNDRDSCTESLKLRNWIYQNYGSSFTKYFYANFPFEQSEFSAEYTPHKKKRKQMSPVTTELDLRNTNLAICELATIFPPESWPNHTTSPCAEYLNDLLQYATDSHHSMENDVLERVLSCADKIILPNTTIAEIDASIFSHLHVYMDTLPSNHTQRTMIFEFFMKHYENHPGISGLETFSSVLSSLPTQLLAILKESSKLKTTSCKLEKGNLSTSLNSTMNCIMSTLRRRDQQIVTALQQQFVELVSTLITTELFCENGACKHCEQFQRKFFETIVSRLHELDRNMTSIIFHLCMNDSTCKNVVCYIADLMVQRIEPYCRKNISRSNSEKMAVLQFLFCLILGCKKEQLFTKPIDHDAVINTISTFKLTKQAAVSVHACDVLFNFCDSDPNVVELLHILLTTSVFSNTKSLNALAWVGLFQVGKTFRSEWLTGLESEFGLLASECIKANMNQPNEGIIMIELCTDLLCTSSSIFHHCLLNLFEDQSHIACLTNLLQSPKLHKSFYQFRKLIADYIDSLKVNSSNEQDIQRLKVTSLSLNFCTNKEF